MAFAPDRDVGAIEEIERLAQLQDATIYNIVHRNAGWGVMFWEEKRQGESANFKDGLVVYDYKPTIREALANEISRLRSC